MFNADSLLPYLTPGAERGGVVLEDGTIVELRNLSEDADGFYPDPNELLPHLDHLAGTWHTHPDAPANLSVEDAETFILWPDLTHYVVGQDGVLAFRVRNGAVIRA